MMRRWALPLLLLAFVLCYLAPLATHGLWIPDETRYAQISQEMLLTGKWAAPHFMGIRYFEKPAAGYWMIALGQAMFGQNLFGVRFASALSTGLSILLVYLVARRLWNDPRKSLVSTLLYMSFVSVAALGGYANLDPQFTFWVNLTGVALWFCFDSRTRNGRLGAWALLGFACGMGFMTKGFLAWLLPVLIALPYALWQKRLRELLGYGLVAVLVAVAVSLPWALAVHLQEPDFWHFFFWHEHIQRFAGEDAQHAEPFWYYLPLLVGFSLPWVALLPATVKQAWLEKRTASIGFLLLWLLMPLAFFSLAKGKLPSYIMPCLLPLALLMGHALAEKLAQGRGRALRVNGWLNLVLGIVALLALSWFQLKKPVYEHGTETLSLVLVFVLLIGWIFANLLQAARPLHLWAAPAIGSWLLVALAPAALPHSVVYNKTPDQFIIDHLPELKQTGALLSNDLGAASALAWRVKRADVTLYNTVGEVKYGLAFADAAHHKVDMAQVQQWMNDARKRGAVGVVMRVKGDDEVAEVNLLPQDGKRYEQGNLVILIFPQVSS
ncbi:lipid IV(A) 4-amino-4-deoxy-L-arabinosyltransferase [Pseudomonas rhodesiae]|jgi:4-amino-4-deoxy-L-arabinose transferase|uniref:Undecaprenyl phosphate-alpha-4-amino-4-deoxy-L-arabinose arabinosyl transferase n=1 Tax=Pseudomonas rhodesiae TaxID=76760 RepID=A0A8I1E3H8_9PSED|nr:MULTISPECIES: lipid IV(A) 4-amino-4-deoxy-L-arabinosyltransferase [Pseudomonas]MBI6603894.1 lipid IV(A) 4-amino-4-deoxy-L-arabinosyltransferase [Pseudomonas sp. S4_EA_1b]MBI6624194.1 lipid IV(A) 4-amino-4-deoxy-L-arabinosyltransferase [Pseudomonas rhodesiae]NMZ16836.1 lipid IV(A) 4-amino-4-deoxy-L-arabinosyltransferase [Pseudomonas rhodesiae]QVN04786.1 lipid IV(A) 4-amino-4-deoxy-L-arabinosyltransferase [Pseudomonas rhodesiae]UVL11467.1 lipid IV(A) 4-amino-4-deoxy-L-arabinosyltransferase [P